MKPSLLVACSLCDNLQAHNDSLAQQSMLQLAHSQETAKLQDTLRTLKQQVGTDCLL